jgi:hypothetical protein
MTCVEITTFIADHPGICGTDNGCRSQYEEQTHVIRTSRASALFGVDESFVKLVRRATQRSSG